MKLAIPSLVGYTANGLPSGLKLNKNTGEISGSPTKPTDDAGVTVTFTKKGAETLTATFIVGPMPTVNVTLAGDTDKCKVSGAKAYLAGAKVSLKATAAKDWVFSCWSTNGVVISQNPTLSFVMPAEDVSYKATFIPVAEDVAAVDFEMDTEYVRGMPIEPVVVSTDGCTSLASVSVSGLPAGLKFTAKALDVKATKTTPAAHYEANTIYGTPTKSGVYTVAAKVTTAGKMTATKTVTVAVLDRSSGERVLEAVGDASMGKVTGSGIYKAGAKVTLKATANAAKKATKTAPAQEATVFAGWFADPEFEMPLVGSVDYRTLSFPYLMPAADTKVYAKFVPATEDAEIVLDVEDSYNTSGAFDLTLDVASVSVPKIAVSGLPTGLKFDAKANRISGAATKPGTYVVTAKLTNTTVKKAIERKFTIVVDNLTEANACFRRPIANAPGEKYVISAGVTEYDLPSLKLSSAETLKVTGLPTGLKYDAANAKITGVATKAGVYTVYLTVGKAVSTMTVEVDALPDWVVGNFEGYGYDQYFGDGDHWTTSPVGHWSGRVQASISSSGKVTTVLTYGIARRGNAQLKCVRGDSYEFEIEGSNISIACREVNGIKVGYMYARWPHTNEWNEHIVTEVKGWQLRWQEFASKCFLPTFAANTETALQMSELKYDNLPTADPRMTLPGSLLLKYGKNGALTVAYSLTNGGKAVATSLAQLVPVEMDEKGCLRMETTILMKLKQDQYFVLHLFLSSPVGPQLVYGDEVLVEDYLLTVND